MVGWIVQLNIHPLFIFQTNKHQKQFYRSLSIMALQFSLSWLILLQFFSRLTHDFNGLKLSKSTALFVFGDSAVDTGSNNYIPTIARSNYAPYGINFPRHIPTGRYSDGKLLPDILCPHKASKMLFLPFCSETYLMMNSFRVSVLHRLQQDLMIKPRVLPMQFQCQSNPDF